MDRRLLFAAVWTACFLLSPVPFAFAATPDVIVSEIGWGGSSKSDADEWVELTNVSAQSVALGGWTMTGALSSGATLTLPDATLAPYQTYLIANYPAGDAKSVLVRTPDLVTSAVSLSNSALQLTLKRADGTVADQAGSGKTPLAGSSAGAVSMVRVAPITDGMQKTSWASATERRGLIEGGTDLGTPGFAETWFAPPPAPSVTPAEPAAATEQAPEPTAVPPAQIEATPDVTDVPPIETDPVPAAAATVPEPQETTVDTALQEPTDPIPDPEPIVEAPETTVVASPMAYPPGTLAISEFVPAPNKGEEEWVEIANPFNNVIPLPGWRLKNARGTSLSLPDQPLGNGQRVVVKAKSGFLTNASGKILLLDPTDAVIDWVAYGTGDVSAPKTGEALALDGANAWRITTTPTPGEANVIAARPTPSARSSTPVVSTQTTAEELPTDAPNTTTVPHAAVPSNDRAPGRFVLSELFPNTGDDLIREFIEVRNGGSEPEDLKGWSLRDARGTVFVQKTKLTLAPGEAIALPRSTTKLSLGNAGGHVELLRPDGSGADDRYYATAPKGQAYALTDRGWDWQPPTPDEANVLTSALEAAEKSTAPNKAKKPAAAPKKASAKKAAAPSVPGQVSGVITKRSGRNVTVENDEGATIVALPTGTDYGALGIKSGRRIEASGLLSATGDKRTLTVAKASDVRTSDPPEAARAPIETQAPEKPAGFPLAVSHFFSSLRGFFFRG